MIPQNDLFGSSTIDTEQAAGLPLITHAGNAVMVFVPGHIYKPSPLQQDSVGKIVGPGALTGSEGKFVAELVKFLDPNFADIPEVKGQIPSSIKAKDKPVEYFLLRNLDRAKGAARFRMGDDNWFYPDFIFWIVDRQAATETQRICYLDPKGLSMGARGGWNHSKVLSFVYKLVELSQDFPSAQTESGQPVSLHFKGALISTTDYVKLQQDTKTSEEFHVFDEDGKKRFPKPDEFARAGIFFGEQDIAAMMDFLHTDDLLMTQVMSSVAKARRLNEAIAPEDEIGCFYRYQINQKNGREEAALGEIIRYALTATSLEQVVTRIQKYCRKELVPYLSANKGLLAKATDHIVDPNSISNPCRRLLEELSSKNG